MTDPAAESKPKDEEWRGNDGAHGRFALGCTVAVIVVLLAFWIGRAAILG